MKLAIQRLVEWFGAGGKGPIRKVRYAALALGVAALAWSSYLVTDARQRDEQARGKVKDLSKAVSELRLQVARQRTSTSALARIEPETDSTVESLVALVGSAARRSGLQLGQSRVIVAPPSAQPAPVAAAPAGSAQTAAPAPAPAPPEAGVEFHLAGSYGAMQRMLRTLGDSKSKFQIVTLDAMRTGLAAKTGAAQLDIRLICVL